MALLLQLLLLLPILAHAADPAVAHTSSGTLHGEKLPASAGEVPVNQFLGVPFAKAQRWQPPKDFTQPYPTEPFNASMWGRACLQVLSPTTSYGSEDCLFANVWQPATAKPGSDLPVLVFIYGGSDQFGEAEPYNMSGLAAYHNTLCINFNYRTGPIGWMAFPDDIKQKRSTGNWGILDIQAALRWVQREAKALGGNPNKVAIHGQSSGGGLVELQYVSPQSKGLFQGAISESGGLGAMDLKQALQNTLAAAKSVGCAEQSAVNKTCMVHLPDLTVTNLTNNYGWGPVVDGVTFPDSPIKMLQQGLINPAHVILGQQTNDSFLDISKEYTRGGLPQPNNYPDGHLQHLTASQYKLALKDSISEPSMLAKVLEMYPAAGSDTHGSVLNVHSLARVESDRGHCSLRQRARYIKRANQDAFVYRFDYWYQSNAQCTAVPNFHLPYLGAIHQDEVTFVMGQPNFMEDGSCCGKWGLSEGEESCAKLRECTACYNTSFGEGYRAYFNEKEFRFTRVIGQFWTNFASSGNPNFRDGVETGSWPSIAGGGVVLDADLEGGQAVEKELYDNPAVCELWDSVAL